MGVFFIGSNKGIALSEIYGRYLILVKQISSSFILTEGVQIRPNVCLSCVNCNKRLGIFYELKVKVQIQIFLKICLTALNTNSSFMH